jgi:hypothetical protein
VADAMKPFQRSVNTLPIRPAALRGDRER